MCTRLKEIDFCFSFFIHLFCLGMCLVCDTTQESSTSICGPCTFYGWTINGFQSNRQPLPIKKLSCTCDVMITLPGFCEACDFKRTKSCKLHYFQVNSNIKHEDYCKLSKK